MNRIQGILFGVITSASFGLIPLFTLPLMAQGMHFDSILFYRFLFASLLLAGTMIVKGESLRVAKREIPILLLLGTFYTGSSMFLFWGYDYMSAGIATTFHFTYPVFVTLILWVIFRTPTSWVTWGAILLATAGVAQLSIHGGEFYLNSIGLIIVLLSAVAYGLYIVGVNKSGIQKMKSRKLTFYVFVVSFILLGIKATSSGGIEPIPNSSSWINLGLLALVPTIISNLALVLAIQKVGATLTAVLGVMEPITAVLVGVILFGEPFTTEMLGGIVMIVAAVTIIILSEPIQKRFGKTRQHPKEDNKKRVQVFGRLEK